MKHSNVKIILIIGMICGIGLGLFGSTTFFKITGALCGGVNAFLLKSLFGSKS